MENIEAQVCPDSASWRAEGETLSKQHKRHQWLIADWLLAGMDSFPATEVYNVAEKLFPQYTRGTLANFVAVARAFPASSRDEALVFAHYRAALSEGIEGARAGWLQQAAANGWSAATLRFRIAHSLELKEAAKAETEGEPAQEQEEEQPEAAPQARSAARPAFTLARLPVSYRAKLAKLAVARRVPEDLLAISILEEALDAAGDEIEVVDQKAAAASAVAGRDMEQRNEEYRQRKGEELASAYGVGSAADYAAAMAEFSAVVNQRHTSGWVPDMFAGFSGPAVYACWRVHRMEAEAWEENAAFDVYRARIAAEAPETVCQPEEQAVAA